jgi:Spy/CpxP family protein refolding chaperone
MQTQLEIQTNDRRVAPVLRNTRRKIVFASMAALMVAGLLMSIARAAGPAAAGDEAGPGEGMPMRRMQRILDRVGATPAQRDQIRAIWSGLRPQLRAERAQHKLIRQQMVASLTAPSINAVEVERLRKQSMANADKISALVTQGMVASAQVLTPEQRKLAQEELAKHGRHHRRGPPTP